MLIDRSNSIIKTVFSKDIVFLMILGLAGLLFSFYRKSEAFPVASLDLTVGRSAVGQIAKRYAKLSGFKIPIDTTSSKYFSFDSEAETFLEYEFPLSEANRLMKNVVPIWYWAVHLIENDHNEFDAKIGVDGKVYSFEREVSKEKFITSETHSAAMAQVIDFTAKELNIALPNWKLIHDDESNLPSRTDHSFIWEDQQIEFKGGHLRIESTVSGDKLTKYDYALHVPDSFTQKFKWLRAQNVALASVSFIIAFLGALSLPVIFLRNWVNGQLRVKFAIGCGIFGALVSYCSSSSQRTTDFGCL
jgi:hypothetical protein